MEAARELAATAWTKPKTENLVLDPVLGEEFAVIIDKLINEPHLGCATTGELLDEIKARCEINGTIGYRTVDDK